MKSLMDRMIDDLVNHQTAFDCCKDPIERIRIKNKMEKLIEKIEKERKRNDIDFNSYDFFGSSCV